MTTIGERIKFLRTEKNLTQKQFGNIFGVVKSTVSQYENTKSIPDDDIKKKIAEYFNVSLDYLHGVTNDRTPSKSKNIEFDPGVEKLILDVSNLSSESKYDLENYIKLLKIRDTFEEYNPKNDKK